MANNIPGTSGNNILTGTIGDDIINRDGDPLSFPGTRGDDRLFGHAGNDKLYGGMGFDTLNGGIGNDLLNGGVGKDLADYNDGTLKAGVTVNLNLQGIAQDTGGAGLDTLVGIENLSGTKFSDTLIGNGDNNQIAGFDGNDQLIGFGGNDSLVGWAGKDTLIGGLGNDLLDGGSGADIMSGGEGNDAYYVSDELDVVDELLDNVFGGIDTVRSYITYSLGAKIEHLTLKGFNAINGTGNAKDNNIYGNDANNVLSGLAGNDLLDGLLGADTMNGGDQNDTYIVDNVGDITAESFNDAVGGVDIVQSSAAFHTIGFGIENLTLTGGAAINGTGNGNNNIITGNGGNNVLSGLVGNDRLLGGNGNDTLNGGTGNDRLDGGTGNDQLNGGDGSDLLNGGGGADTLIGGFGADTFLLRGAIESQPSSFNRDVITDFAGAGAALGDQINLAEIDANVLLAGNQAFSYIGAAAFSAAGQVRYAGGILSGSIDGDTAAEFEIQLVGTPPPSLFVKAGHSGTDILL